MFASTEAQATCMQVGMEDGDSIDVVIHQVGGRQA